MNVQGEIIKIFFCRFISWSSLKLEYLELFLVLSIINEKLKFSFFAFEIYLNMILFILRFGYNNAKYTHRLHITHPTLSAVIHWGKKITHKRINNKSHSCSEIIFLLRIVFPLFYYHTLPSA